MEEKIKSVLSKVPEANWQQLSHLKIFWGHQSVGSNIIDGLQGLLDSNPQIPLKIIRQEKPFTMKPGVLVHAYVGSNYDPFSKIKDFVDLVGAGVGNQADFAFFKFCWIDFNAGSDVEAVFEEYRKTMEELKQKYPETRFMHATIPLLKVQSGPKAWVKKIIGRLLDGTRDNIKREEFNTLLRNEYQGKDPIFDIAKYESTRPDGSRETFTMDGRQNFALVPGYTNDGGHLNNTGSRYLASEFLLFLAGLADRKN